MVLKSMLGGRAFPYRGLARVFLGIGILAFALPFATVSCGGHDVLTATGVNAIMGGQYAVNGSQVQHYSGDIAFLLAFVGGIAALACQFLRVQVRTRVVSSAAASLWSVVMLLIGLANVNAELFDASLPTVLTVRWAVGFWTALLAMGASAVMAVLEIYGPGVRSSAAGSDSPAPPGALRFMTPPAGATMPRTWAVTGGGLVAVVASVMVLVACQLPYIHYSDSTQPATASVFNPGYAPSNWFAAEPAGVALLTLVAGVVLITWMSLIPRAIAAAALLAFGAQTFLLFLGYVELAVTSPSAQVRPGGIVGMVAGVVLVAGGLAAALTLFVRVPAPAVHETPAADSKV